MSGVRLLNYIDVGTPDARLRLDIERIIDEGIAEGRASCFMTSDILRRIATEDTGERSTSAPGAHKEAATPVTTEWRRPTGLEST